MEVELWKSVILQRKMRVESSEYGFCYEKMVVESELTILTLDQSFAMRGIRSFMLQMSFLMVC